MYIETIDETFPEGIIREMAKKEMRIKKCILEMINNDNVLMYYEIQSRLYSDYKINISDIFGEEKIWWCKKVLIWAGLSHTLIKVLESLLNPPNHKMVLCKTSRVLFQSLSFVRLSSDGKPMIYDDVKFPYIPDNMQLDEVYEYSNTLKEVHFLPMMFVNSKFMPLKLGLTIDADSLFIENNGLILKGYLKVMK